MREATRGDDINDTVERSLSDSDDRAACKQRKPSVTRRHGCKAERGRTSRGREQPFRTQEALDAPTRKACDDVAPELECQENAGRFLAQAESPANRRPD